MPPEPIDSAARTLPLYDPAPADADGWHAVRSPGGYEGWYFDAEDPAAGEGGVRLVAMFTEGFVFHPGYLRRYARYRSRPTRHAPPVPAEYPCACLAVYEGGRVLAQFTQQVRPEAFRAEAERLDVRAGENGVSRSPDGSLRLRLAGSPCRLTWRGPQRSGAGPLRADLTFTPIIRPPSPVATSPGARHERRLFSREISGADHRWVIADPLCRVEGDIRLGGASQGNGSGSGNGTLPRVIRVAGLGYHDHNFGTAPIGAGLRRWMWGRMLWKDHMVTFHYACPTRQDLPDEVHLIEADAAGVRDLPAGRVEADWAGRTALGLLYPSALRFSSADGSAAGLSLNAPQVIDAAPFYLRLAYEGRFAERTGKALCEVAYPHRLTWPLLGRMIEMSIEKPGG